MKKIPYYPQSVDIELELREYLHPMFQALSEGISEFTFANIYLFRKDHLYEISKIKVDGSENNGDIVVITGNDSGEKFFMLPFGIPPIKYLRTLFENHRTLKCASRSQVELLLDMGYTVFEDRDNFDYLYHRQHLADLPGRKFHKKRNLIKAFINNHSYEGRPLLDEYIPHALEILEKWRRNRDNDGDYYPAREALEKCHPLQLCGGIYYVDSKPVAYSLGEENACGKSFVIHFEKAVTGYKGLWQFVNQAFASIITEYYETINREQDLGDEGLRKAKLSYQPSGFVKKYRICHKL
ncbi:conserved hypothetical protein [Desulfamplus magnetovallimortis]|uniref:Phosphatidylglycerol lysyltransferase C-terminal domain-containing protein n=1 Tax=Desulfamplus magnetovallimortis TaxID=1246637 RepID=A0A1W1HBH7_9BACT|nr:DUF2156 domain-containing protein [Desulfamplus magnetovallimortis]SLM29830.1 conserved hypothetical protein [Desulfamplus magnetovallimortis]